MDAPVIPRRVLPGHPQDQSGCARRDGVKGPTIGSRSCRVRTDESKGDSARAADVLSVVGVGFRTFSSRSAAKRRSCRRPRGGLLRRRARTRGLPRRARRDSGSSPQRRRRSLGAGFRARGRGGAVPRCSARRTRRESFRGVAWRARAGGRGSLLERCVPTARRTRSLGVRGRG